MHGSGCSLLLLLLLQQPLLLLLLDKSASTWAGVDMSQLVCSPWHLG
jgi:hypothetical protein